MKSTPIPVANFPPLLAGVYEGDRLLRISRFDDPREVVCKIYNELATGGRSMAPLEKGDNGQPFEIWLTDEAGNSELITRCPDRRIAKAWVKEWNRAPVGFRISVRKRKGGVR